MSLYKRKDSPYWWVKLSHNGRTLQRTSGTSDRRKAKEYHDRLKAELWDQERLGVKPRRAWEEAVLRWNDEKAHKASIGDDLMHFRWLRPHLAGRSLSDIDRDLIDQLVKARRAEGVSNATVNRMLALVRSVLRIAVDEWEWLERAPKVKLLSEPKRRVRFLTEDEANRLLAELPPHLAAMAWFSLLTGLRQRNVRELRWSQVNLTERVAWIHPDEAKARKAIPVPLSIAAVKVIQDQIVAGSPYVFTYKGLPIRQVNTKAWRNALNRAGIEDFRWHDLRHTWASWHVQRGTPLYALQELGGWASVEMVRRYAHFSPAHLTTHVDRFADQIGLRPILGGDNSATQKEVLH
ncbi:MAG: site-specific integrase [Nevskia sp.]|nr:site-specific integrase [Nevskia sp.]